ncbi:MAG: insulinase family protein [Myxococcales bacterium]|nr:insulinase family protein [Myxococcales bacterium]
MTTHRQMLVLVGLAGGLTGALPASRLKPPPTPVVEAVPPVVPALAPTRLAPPGPTAPRPFTLPLARSATLSNGISVHVVESHDVPLVSVRMAFRGAGLTDPVGKEGLAGVSAALMNQGAGSLDAEAWDKELRRLGTLMGVAADAEDVAAELSALKRNLPASLDRLRDLVLTPRFEKQEWELLASRWRDSVISRRSDPSSTANWVLDKVVYGEAYKGRKLDEASLDRISTRDMRGWRTRVLVPGSCAIFIGGDVTLEEVQPLLEARFGSWKAKAPAKSPVVSQPVAPSASMLTLVDDPGAAQSVIVGTGYVGRPADADYFPLVVANYSMGGQFMSRVNLNLREDKGYTYGARTTVGYDLAGTQFQTSAPVVADKTVPALVELVKELRGPLEDRPVTELEVQNAQGGLLMARPLKFEDPGFLLGQLERMWSFGLPEDWVATYEAKVRAVDASAASGAWKAAIHADTLHYVIVGDLASIEPGLREQAAAWGWTVEVRDVDGKVVAPLVQP